jgi:hypothetical protein
VVRGVVVLGDNYPPPTFAGNRNCLIDQLLIKGEEVKFFLKLISIRLLTKRAEPSKLQEIYPTFDAQNMPRNGNNRVFAGFTELLK